MPGARVDFVGSAKRNVSMQKFPKVMPLSEETPSHVAQWPESGPFDPEGFGGPDPDNPGKVEEAEHAACEVDGEIEQEV